MCLKTLLKELVLEAFFLRLNIQVTMFRGNCGPSKMEFLLIFSIGTVFLAAAMKKEPNTGLGIPAEAGRIELPSLTTRETTGI